MILVYNKSFTPKKLKKRYKGNYTFLCFIDDYFERRKWEDGLSEIYVKIDIKHLLEDKKTEIRESYIDFLDGIGKDYDELWSLSPISEQNTYVSNLFLDCCRLKIIDDFLGKEKEQELIVIVDDVYLFDAIILLLNRKRKDVKSIKKFIFYIEKIKHHFIPLYHTLKFILIFFHNKYLQFFSGVSKSPESGQADEKLNNIVLHTWIDDGAFSNDGTYRDRYFGRLIEWFEKNKYRIFIVPYIYNMNKPLKDVLKLLKNSKIKFLIPFEYYSIFDLFKGFFCMIKVLSIPKGPVSFLHMDIEKIIKREKLRRTGGFLPFFLYLDLFMQFKRKGLTFDIAIDVFEGMIPERAWILGIKRAYNKTYTIGYQHTIFSKDLLCYFVYKGNSLKEVLPDKIICTGPMLKNLLIREGLPENHIDVGCALRYEYLWNKLKQQYVDTRLTPENSKKKILISLPLQHSGAIELIYKTVNIAKKKKDIKFFIKPHPMMNKDIIKEMLKNINWPDYDNSIADGPMDNWIWNIDLLISTASAAIMDALVVGKPILIIGREGVLDLNPLDWIESEYTMVYSEQSEIEKRIDKLLYLDQTELEKLKQFGIEIMKGCFNEITDDNLKVFVSQT